MSDKRTGKKTKKPVLAVATSVDGTVVAPVATTPSVTAKKQHRK